MPRNLTTGSVEKVRGRWRARISWPKKLPERPRRLRAWFWLPEGIDEKRARDLAQQLAEAARDGRLAYPNRGARGVLQASDGNYPDRTADGRETVKGWCLRWLAARRLRELKSVRSDESRLRTWLWPSLGKLAMADVCADHIEAWVELIDEKVRERELGWKTAQNAWGTLSKMFDDARAGKPRELRVRKDNPAEGVRPPDRGTRRAKQFLYPSEFLRVVGCDAIDVRVRQVYAVAAYLYPRAGELEALHCEDIDLLHHTVHIHRARHESGEIRETKGNRPRRVAIRGEVVPVLARLVAQVGGRGLVWPEWPLWTDAACELRRHLTRAGVDRQELHDGAATTKPMTFHDLRATGITWEAVAGTDALRIQQRAGHASLATTQVYLRLAEAVGIEGFGSPFPPLPESLWRAPRPAVGPAVGPTVGPTPGLGTSSHDGETRGNLTVRGGGLEPPRLVSERVDTSRNVPNFDPTAPNLPGSIPLDTFEHVSGGPAGTNGGTNPGPVDLALRAAIIAALDEGNHQLAGDLLEMLRRRHLPPTGNSTGEGAAVIDLAKRRRARGL